MCVCEREREHYGQVLDEDGKAPSELAETYGARVVTASGFAQVECELYRPCEFVFTDLGFFVQVYLEHGYLIVETLRQVRTRALD